MTWPCPACGAPTELAIDSGDASVGVDDGVQWEGCDCGHELTDDEYYAAYDFALGEMTEARAEATISAMEAMIDDGGHDGLR